MNFEEILHTKEGSPSRQEAMSFGMLYKKQIDRKYCFVLAVKPQLLESLGFRKGLAEDADKNMHSRIKQQLHYEIHEESDGVELELESGSYQTFEQLLYTNPAIVAKSGFINNVVEQLMNGLEEMHAQSVYHLCLAPQNLLIRKGDEMPMMLLHASSFPVSSLLQHAFADSQAYIAPEVIEGQQASVYSDIYSLGCFIKKLFEQGSVPYEYKGVIAKATQTNPEKRYASIAEMRADLQKRRVMKHSFLSLVAALAIVLFGLALYIELMPQAEDVEFVEAPPKEVENPIFDESFSPGDSIDIEILTDSGEMDTVTMEQRQAVEMYMKKSEEIFRKQFSREADRVLSKIYSNENMNASEKKFMSSNNLMRDELLKIQSDLAEKSGISDDVAGRITTEVIEMLTAQKQKQLNYNSSQPSKEAGTTTNK